MHKKNVISSRIGENHVLFALREPSFELLFVLTFTHPSSIAVSEQLWKSEFLVPGAGRTIVSRGGQLDLGCTFRVKVLM